MSLRKNFERWHERPWTYVCECLRKATKVESGQRQCKEHCIDNVPCYLSGISRGKKLCGRRGPKIAVQSVFTHVVSIDANLLEQQKAFA